MVANANTIIIACLVTAFAGSLTMAYGAFSEGKKYEPARSPEIAAITIGISYFAGGLIVCLPFLFPVNNALFLSATFAGLILLVAGFIESSLHGASGWKGALRVLLFAGFAFTAAYFAGQLFKV